MPSAASNEKAPVALFALGRERREPLTIVKLRPLISAIDAALLFIIPYAKVKKQLEEVPPHERANPISIEYRIHSSSRKHFDVLEFPEI